METITTFEFTQDDYEFLKYIDENILEYIHFPETVEDFEVIKKTHFQRLFKMCAQFMDNSLTMIYLSILKNKIYFVLIDGLSIVNKYDIKYGIIENFLRQKDNRKVLKYGKYKVDYFDSMCLPLLKRISKYDLIQKFILQKFENHTPKFEPTTNSFIDYEKNIFSITYSSFEELYFIFTRDHYDAKFKEFLDIKFEHTSPLDYNLGKIIFSEEYTNYKSNQIEISH